MLYLTREEFRTAATTLGFKPATLRQWRHAADTNIDA
jgi:hypothetical protein